MARKPETKLKDKIRTALGAHAASMNEPIYIFKKHGGPHGERGVPDLVGCYRSYFFALEVKTPQNKAGATDNQRAHIDRIRTAGGLAFIVRSTEAAVKVLQKIDRKVANEGVRSR